MQSLTRDIPKIRWKRMRRPSWGNGWQFRVDGKCFVWIEPGHMENWRANVKVFLDPRSHPDEDYCLFESAMCQGEDGAKKRAQELFEKLWAIRSIVLDAAPVIQATGYPIAWWVGTCACAKVIAAVAVFSAAELYHFPTGLLFDGGTELQWTLGDPSWMRGRALKACEIHKLPKPPPPPKFGEGLFR